MAEVTQHVRKFVFRDSGDRNTSGECLEVLIPEVVSASYGMYTWPCAPVLAQYIFYNRHLFNKSTVLELGAGTALPGIVAAKIGANTLITDSAQLPKCLRSSEMSVQANGLSQVSVIGLTWGLFTPELLNFPKIDFILGSDCFYDPSVFEDILVTISYIMERCPHAKFICSYQERVTDWSLVYLLNKWNLDYREIPLESFGAVPQSNIAGSNLPGNHTIHVFEITRRDQYH